MRIKLGRILFIIALICFYNQSFAQDWVEKMQDPKVNFYDVQKSFNEYWKNKEVGRSKGWKQYKRWEHFMMPRVFPSGNRIEMESAWKTYNEYKNKRSSITNSSSNWQALGPFAPPTNGGDAGRLNCIAFHPTNMNIIYVGSPSGGLWKTIDGGSTWVSLTDNLPVIGVSSIVVDYSNPNIVYIATGDGDATDTYSIGILKSLDGGQSFQTTGLNYLVETRRSINKLIINPLNPKTLFAATSSGVFRSFNGGDTWENTLFGKTIDITYKPGDTTVMYATSNTDFYKSTDAGENFFYKAISFAAPSSRVQIAVTQANSNYVYLLTGKSSDQSFAGVYRSTDSGENFTTRSTTPNILDWSVDGSGTGGQAWYDLSIAASPTNAEEIYVGGVNVWKSLNGGTNWTLSAHWYGGGGKPKVHADIHALKFNPSNILYACSDGGVSTTSNGGTNWYDKNDALSIGQIYKLSVSQTQPTTIITGWQDNGTNLYRNNSWTQVNGGDGMECIIDYTNPNIFYVTNPNGQIQRTDNGGNSWSYNISSTITQTETGAWVTPYVIDPVNHLTLYAGYNNVWKTTNKGASWTKISNFANTIELKSLAVAKSNPNYIYAASDNIIYKTSNGGSTWTDISHGLPGNAITYITVSTTNPDVLWISISGYSSGQKIYTSRNGGLNWTNYSGTLPNLPANCIALDDQSNEGLYVGMDVGIYYRDTLLTDWTLYSNNLPNVVIGELEISPSLNKIRVATYGRGVWESPLYTPVSVPEIENINYQLSIFPSPTAGIINIDVSGLEISDASDIDIFTFEGQKVLTTAANFKNKNGKIDFSNHANGIYIISIKTKEKTYKGRFVKVSK
ncbi:MAG: T9SS type A sorting domain-containing protein [Bacteroidetes bacterium]|nr:T9SS type A sorting domain-containing protein [Bacteroidota bacterium]